MDMIKDKIKRDIDVLANNARLKWVDVTQSVIYNEKSEEATDFVAAGYPTDLSWYPYINAEKEATGADPKYIADRILYKRQQWVLKMAQLEKLRLQHKHLVDSAEERAQIAEYFDQFITLLDNWNTK